MKINCLPEFPSLGLMSRVTGLLVMIRRLTLNSLQSPELLPSGGHGQWRPSRCHAPLPPSSSPAHSRAELISGSDTHTGHCRGLQLPQGEAPLHQGQVVLLHHGLHARWVWLGKRVPLSSCCCCRHDPGHILLRHILDRVERGAGPRHPRRDHHAQLLHHLQQVSS